MGIMTEPQPLDTSGAVARVERILNDRGITPAPGGAEPAYRPDEPGHPEYHRRQRAEVASGRWMAATPPRYQTATATQPGVIAWATAVAADPGATPSLLITGPTGTGKTHEAYGALRLIAETGPSVFQMIAITTADLYGLLRPTGAVGAAEHEMRRVCDVPLLLLDDLGSAKASEWTEEITYRLINHRYNQCLPTIFTSNLPPKAPVDANGRPQGPDLAGALGERIVSRLAEMTTLVAVTGSDRRRPVSVS